MIIAVNVLGPARSLPVNRYAVRIAADSFSFDYLADPDAIVLAESSVEAVRSLVRSLEAPARPDGLLPPLMLAARDWLTSRGYRS